jgi:hypothetical protein
MEWPAIFIVGVPQVSDTGADEQANENEPGMVEQEIHRFSP